MVDDILTFRLTFHGPFRVATGEAASGADVAVDAHNPLPASSLKGLMRAEAVRFLGPDHPLIRRTFGGDGRSSGWAWTDAEFEAPPTVRERSRVAINEHTGAAVKGGLVRGQEMWTDRPARFQVLWREFEPPPGEQADLLRGVAAMIKAIGSDRRRGFGWVSVEAEGQSPEQLAEGLIAAGSPTHHQVEGAVDG